MSLFIVIIKKQTNHCTKYQKVKAKINKIKIIKVNGSSV